MKLGELYQLRSKQELEVDQDVSINGPYDKFGYIVKIIKKEATGILYLIRGTGNETKSGIKINLPKF